MLYPKFIKQGECIGVPSPSDGAYDELKANRFKNAKLKIEKLGFNVKLSENIFCSKKARSADCITRAKEINNMFEDKNIDAIICAAGGEFLVEILPYIDFEKIVNNPKIIQGFSDPTGLLFPITTKYDIATIYGQNFSSYGAEEYHKSVLDSLEFLKGNIIEQKSFDLYEEERVPQITGLESDNLTKKVEWKLLNCDKVGIRARIIGGCFDIICELSGTKYDGTKDFIERYKDDGIIWYFDNCEISKEELIRSLWKLNEFSYFKYTKAIIWGRNGAETSCLGYNMADCLKDSVIYNLNIPIIYDADISHKAPCMNIINGAIANVKVENGKGSIFFELV